MVDPSDFEAARRYLTPSSAAPWRWGDEGQVVEWADGSTVAFREELDGILRHLAPRGLPPMTALLLLLAACRESWGRTADHLVMNFGLAATIERSDVPDWLPEFCRRLDAVHALPADLRCDLEARTVLAETVFEDSPVAISATDASRVVRGLAVCTEPACLVPRHGGSQSWIALLGDLRLLDDGLVKVDAEALRLRCKTGLDVLVRPADVDLGPADRIRRLIAELRDDAELGGVARVAGQLLAAIHLPRPVAAHEDLPVGGTSDITNRGPLDRLLISELAQDDLTLAVRVAMNEALYLRREAPPRNPPRHRAVLIDAGIRLWGVPRVFATAVAMAMVATADRHTTVDLYRAQGSGVVPVDLTHRNGLVEHLSALSPDIHPGKALPPFAEAVSATSRVADPVVITGEDVAADPEFRQAIAAWKAPSLLLATVARDGSFRMVAFRAKGRRAVLESRLKLDELLAPHLPTAAPLLDERQSADLPAILAVRPFPLLLSYQPVKPTQHWAVGKQGVLGISRERCLMHWQRGASTARLLAEEMPAGPVHWVAGTELVSSVVVGQLQQKSLWLLNVDLQTDACHVLPLEVGPEHPRHVCGHGGMVFIVYPQRIDAFETDSGRKRQSLELPQRSIWRHGRFFFGTDDWYAVTYDGIVVRLQPIFATRNHRERGREYLAFLDVEGHDGPIGLRPDGTLYDSARNRSIPVAHGLKGRVTLRAIARNGRRIVLSGQDSPYEMAAVEVPSGQSHRVWQGPSILVESELQCLAPKSVRRQVQAVYLDGSGQLTLIFRKGNRLRITRDASTRQMTLAATDAAGEVKSTSRAFRRIPSQRSGGGVALSVVTWGDGSRIFLDSRGMLHLKSSDTAIPEMTLLLNNGDLAGWCADGRVWGPSCFTGTANSADPEAIYTGVFRSFLERLR